MSTDHLVQVDPALGSDQAAGALLVRDGGGIVAALAAHGGRADGGLGRRPPPAQAGSGRQRATAARPAHLLRPMAGGRPGPVAPVAHLAGRRRPAARGHRRRDPRAPLAGADGHRLGPARRPGHQRLADRPRPRAVCRLPSGRRWVPRWRLVGRPAPARRLPHRARARRHRRSRQRGRRHDDPGPHQPARLRHGRSRAGGGPGAAGRPGLPPLPRRSGHRVGRVPGRRHRPPADRAGRRAGAAAGRTGGHPLPAGPRATATRGQPRAERPAARSHPGDGNEPGDVQRRPRRAPRRLTQRRHRPRPGGGPHQHDRRPGQVGRPAAGQPPRARLRTTPPSSSPAAPSEAPHRCGRIAR